MGQAVKLIANAVDNDILSDQEIRDVEVPSVVQMAASGATVDDQVGLRLGKSIIFPDGNINIEESADVLHGFGSGRDTLVESIVIGPGKLRLPIVVVTAEVQVLVQVDPLDPTFAISGQA